MLGKTSSYSIDISGIDRNTLLFYKKCYLCHLLPFAKEGQYSHWVNKVKSNTFLQDNYQGVIIMSLL